MTAVRRGDMLLAVIHDHPGLDALALRQYGVTSADVRVIADMDRVGLVVYRAGGWFLTAKGDLRLLAIALPPTTTPPTGTDEMVAHLHVDHDVTHTHARGQVHHSHFDPVVENAERIHRPGGDYVTSPEGRRKR